MLHQARRKAATSKQRLRDPPQRKEITKRNAIESPLLRLPPEIRNGIYAYVFGNTRYRFQPNIRPGGFPVVVKPDQTEYRHPNLPLVCHQLYHETRLLPYKLGTFSFEQWHAYSLDDPFFFSDIRTFLSKRSKSEVEALQTLAFKDSTGNGMYWAKQLGLKQFLS
ncbi:hypothetical protein AA0120_g12343 [Alternaria tenuissima]|uniref:Uncharacterized protein n=1 Tax=Alternaria tenuissima TaxID=119927 RepID=A0AB37VZ82_9PLEO|nr:hypothetical protein AA0115_g12926 [Alternaria tenuissima]RYN74418.1 hypothetical protein AA0120_g12343 [Alternaria tenuissima]